MDPMAIIAALHNNTCPECGRHFMAADSAVIKGKDGRKGIRCRIFCGHCAKSWRIPGDFFNDHVRPEDDINYKQRHPEVTDVDLDIEVCPECGTIIDNSYEDQGELVCRVCGVNLSEDLFD